MNTRSTGVLIIALVAVLAFGVALAVWLAHQVGDKDLRTPCFPLTCAPFAAIFILGMISLAIRKNGRKH